MFGLQRVDSSAAAHEVIVVRIAVQDGKAGVGFVQPGAVVARVNLRD